MKKDYTLSQQFALIGLDGQSCIHSSAAKNAAVRGIAAAALLEELLYREDEPLTAAEFQKKLETGIAALKSMKKKEMKAVEKDAVKVLLADGVMDIVPDLLGCDMNYDTAGVEMKSYRSDREVYLSIVESVRAEILEDGPVTMECICLLWLIRESGCIHDICSVQEQEKIQERMVALCVQGDKAGVEPEKDEGGILTDAVCTGMIWKQEFHKTAEQMVRSFLKGKRKLFKNPYLEGINLLFPFLDRRQAIFIDFVVLGTNVMGRRQAVEAYLSERGHYVEEVKNGTETLLRIDNMYYRIWPKTVQIGKIPVQGANLLPVYR